MRVSPNLRQALAPAFLFGHHSLVRTRMKKFELMRASRALAPAIVAIGCGGETGQQSCLDCSGQHTTSVSNSGGATGSTAKSATTAKSGLPSCTWPAFLDADPGSRDHCHAARRLLACTFGGGGEECTTDGEATCSDSMTGATCMDHCAPNEYVAACGGVGPGPVPDPPSGCRYAFAEPSGVGFYCCPCGS